MGSDDQVWKGKERPGLALEQAARDVHNAIDRPLDVRFAMDQLTALNCQPGPLQNRLDLKDDAAAKSWLAAGGFHGEMGKNGTLEVKNGTAKR